MKIVEENPAPLTNPEVLKVLKERVESSSAGSTGALNSEQEVLKTLEQRGTITKSREEIETFVTAVKSELPLSTEDVLQLINHIPSNIFETFLCLEPAINEGRLSEEDLDRVLEIVNQYLKQ